MRHYTLENECLLEITIAGKMYRMTPTEILESEVKDGLPEHLLRQVNLFHDASQIATEIKNDVARYGGVNHE